ncbi:MobC family plasmid mobilization relaxosome protein [Mobiluncus curtisii]|uniref:Bacterial mobilisation protein (MobC) n=1 Tax=Mobiluncus curtisii TaxID=2051 RepID=A0A2X2YN11_9ACTO|nr:MobC family plasmid mobilization relaxosome protein [Mobiluncus curtisii]QQU08083.1 MobC family plasmid mobilization relaxosome protein [Mobiluncus curtisii]SQB64281.1 Bacterial mobilisation protein (MobC) [Mobiluncus curtisii]
MDVPRDAGRNGRSVVRKTYVSPGEWDMIASRMHAVEQTNFSRFARVLLTNGKVRVSSSRALSEILTRLIAPIGNNINQIARQANTNDIATYAMVEETFRLMSEVQAVIERLEDDKDYGGNEDWPDTLNAESSD